MANLGITFDSTQTEPQKPLDTTPLPAGKYTAVVSKSDVKATKAGTGSFAEFEMDVIDGEHKGRKLWARLTLQNPNQTAVDIGRGQLSALCRAAGHFGQLADTAELHNKPVVVVVKIKRREDTGDLTNEVTGFEPCGGASSSPAAPPKPATSPSTPPWMQRKTA